ncbi:MAG TPA: hypothetical protein VFM88_01345 [Vicinamibacteria bacterium]|nr:hypothetical protein [Vicinamibacteria bacterium]
MRWRTMPIGLAAALGAAALAQQPESEPAGGLAGRWTGAAKLQTDGAKPCRYEGGLDPPSLILELRADGGGRLRMNLETPVGTACPPVAVDSPVIDTALTPTTASFKDAQGREWNLALQAGVLRGLFSGTDLSGELTLSRRRGPERRAAAAKAAAPGTPPSPSPSPGPSPSPEPPAEAGGTAEGKGGAGSMPKGPGLKSGALGFVAANVVGLGALLAVNRAAQDDSAGTSTLICSPRSCVIGAPGEPCDCTSLITTGADCGQTDAGVPIRGACAPPVLPCQALLSCNNGVCEDRLGSCPF